MYLLILIPIEILYDFNIHITDYEKAKCNMAWTKGKWENSLTMEWHGTEANKIPRKKLVLDNIGNNSLSHLVQHSSYASGYSAGAQLNTYPTTFLLKKSQHFSQKTQVSTYSNSILKLCLRTY